MQRITVPNWLPPGGRCFLLDLGLTAWNTALACIKFSMYWPRTEFSDRNLRFSSFTASTRLVRSSRVFWSSKTYNSWISIWVNSDIAYIWLYYYDYFTITSYFMPNLRYQSSLLFGLIGGYRLQFTWNMTMKVFCCGKCKKLSVLSCRLVFSCSYEIKFRAMILIAVICV